MGDVYERSNNIATCLKSTSGTIALMKAVYPVGGDGEIVTVELAKSDSGTTMPSIGISCEAFSDTEAGPVIFSGMITGVDTSSWTAGDELWVSSATAGELTTTQPQGVPEEEKVGQVLYSHASDGMLLVYNAGSVAHSKEAGGDLHTPTQVGLTNVTDDAQLKRSANDFSTFTEKASPVSADLLLVEDSAASGVKKKVQIGNLAPYTYAGTISVWTPSGGLYYADVSHNLGSNDIVVHAYTPADGLTVGLEDIDRTDTNTVRIWSATNTENVRVIVVASGGSPISAITKRIYYADQLDSPNSADWTVNALAPAVADPTNAALVVRRFDDTTEEGVGFIIEIPTDATSIKLYFKSRAITAPGAARTVGIKLYSRGVPDNAAVESWDSGTQWTDIDIPTNANFQYDSESKTLSSLSLTAGRVYQFELTRVNPSGGTELVDDWALLELDVEFS